MTKRPRHGGGGQGRPEGPGRRARTRINPLDDDLVPPRRRHGGRVSRWRHASERRDARAARRSCLPIRHAQGSIALAAAHVAAKPRDPEAHHQIGATLGLQASYIATIDGPILGAFRAARRAYDERETVLELDPSRKDAGPVVGMYRYVVSLMRLPMRMVAYVPARR